MMLHKPPRPSARSARVGQVHPAVPYLSGGVFVFLVAATGLLASLAHAQPPASSTLKPVPPLSTVTPAAGPQLAAQPAAEPEPPSLPGYTVTGSPLTGVRLRPIPDPKPLPGSIAAMVAAEDAQINEDTQPSQPTGGHAWLAFGQLHPATDTYAHLVDGLKSGQRIAVVQYGRLTGNGMILATGARRFGLRYAPAEGAFKLSPFAPLAGAGSQNDTSTTNPLAATAGTGAETTIAGATTLQEVMFNLNGLSLTCRHNRACAATVPSAGKVQLGVAWEEVDATGSNGGGTRTWSTWMDWLTLKPLWGHALQVEGEAALAS